MLNVKYGRVFMARSSLCTCPVSLLEQLYIVAASQQNIQREHSYPYLPNPSEQGGFVVAFALQKKTFRTF